MGRTNCLRYPGWNACLPLCIPATAGTKWNDSRYLLSYNAAAGNHWIAVTETITPHASTMKVTKSIGTLLLAIYLILQGLVGLGVGFPQVQFILAILALVAGIFLLIGK